MRKRNTLAAWVDLVIAIQQALPKPYREKVLELLTLWCLVHFDENGKFIE